MVRPQQTTPQGLVNWLYLQIKMCDPLGVEILNSIEDLLDELSGLLFAERFLLSQEIEQLSSRDPVTHTNTQWASCGL